jgi:hypothetical protein
VVTNRSEAMAKNFRQLETKMGPERRADMYVSTLQDFVKAMGGQLEIRAVFPDGTVRITQLSELAKAR